MTDNEPQGISINKEDLESILDILFENTEALESYRGHHGSTREELKKFVEKYGLKVTCFNT